LILLTSGSSNAYAYTNTNVLPLNTWFYIGFVFDGSQTGNANRLKAYYNGAQQNLIFNSIIPNRTSGETNSALTLAYYNVFNYLNGGIANFHIYNRALDQSEIQQNYNALKNRFGLP
jgi:hypothetical protein